jgi:spermidine synthase
MIVYFLFSRREATAMFTSGFTGAATELLLIISFQVIFGYVYLFIGIIITVFMAGLAIGSRLSRFGELSDPLRMMYFVQLFSGIYIASIALTIFFVTNLESSFLVKLIFMFMMFIVAALTGMQYGVAVCFKKQDAGITVSKIYTADLAGSAAGSLVVAVWMIPLIGIYTSLLVLSVLHILTIGLISIKRK